MLAVAKGALTVTLDFAGPEPPGTPHGYVCYEDLTWENKPGYQCDDMVSGKFCADGFVLSDFYLSERNDDANGKNYDDMCCACGGGTWGPPPSPGGAAPEYT